MLYYLFNFINQKFSPPGFDIFRFITFRSAATAVTALLISFILGPKIIDYLKKKQIGEAAKLEAPKNHLSKAGTPTMGGLIVIGSTLIPTLLWGDIKNIFIILIMVVTAWLCAVGFLDDYLKVVKKKQKGLIGTYKIIGQVLISLILGLVITFHPQFEKFYSITTVPFFKDLVFDYSYFYIPVLIFIMVATSNAVNLTDGLDGLAIGTVSISFLGLAGICYVTGHEVFSDYLNILYIPGSGELTVFCASLVGAGLGFLWYNSYPAEIFMGDTGSLALGGALGAVFILVKKELVLPILGGIFFIETVSVLIQKIYFKYTKKKYGAGKRIFKMAPIHHHFELCGWSEPKIVVRFYIVAVLLAILTLTTFKVR